MKKICITKKHVKDPDGSSAQRVKKVIERFGMECEILPEVSKDSSFSQVDPEEIPEDTDCVLVMGGDGTMLGVSRDLMGHDYPLLGMNLGHLGYLTEVEWTNLEETARKLAEDSYFLESRMMIAGNICWGDVEYMQDAALNDVVFGRMGQSQLTMLNLYVNGNLLNTYSADGLIISTPNGSTAYNLSAGGPIIEPTASAFVVTPICSHVLGVQSIVLSGEDILEVEIPTQIRHLELPVGVTFDGEPMYRLSFGDRVKISKSKESIHLIKLSAVSFLETLRKKMQ